MSTYTKTSQYLYFENKQLKKGYRGDSCNLCDKSQVYPKTVYEDTVGE